MPDFPVLMHTAVDAPDCRGLAEFYRELLGLHYRPGDEPPSDGGRRTTPTGWSCSTRTAVACSRSSRRPT